MIINFLALEALNNKSINNVRHFIFKKNYGKNKIKMISFDFCGITKLHARSPRYLNELIAFKNHILFSVSFNSICNQDNLQVFIISMSKFFLKIKKK